MKRMAAKITNKIICFDVDGTLVEHKSSWEALTLALGCSSGSINQIHKETNSGIMPFDRGVRLVEEMYRASGRATENFIREFFESISLKDEAKDVADHLHNKRYSIYLVSGAIDIYVASIAKKIGADGFFSHASLEFNDSGSLSKINYGKNQRLAKAKRIRELSAKFDVPKNQITFVGDSENDVEAFKLTGRGIAVHPYDKELDKIAWKKIRMLSEIKNFL